MLGMTTERNTILPFFQHQSWHATPMFIFSLWNHYGSLSYTFYRSMQATIYQVFWAALCYKARCNMHIAALRKGLAILCPQKTTCCSESVISHRQWLTLVQRQSELPPPQWNPGCSTCLGNKSHRAEWDPGLSSGGQTNAHIDT